MRDNTRINIDLHILGQICGLLGWLRGGGSWNWLHVTRLVTVSVWSFLGILVGLLKGHAVLIE